MSFNYKFEDPLFAFGDKSHYKDKKIKKRINHKDLINPQNRF